MGPQQVAALRSDLWMTVSKAHKKLPWSFMAANHGSAFHGANFSGGASTELGVRDAVREHAIEQGRGHADGDFSLQVIFCSLCLLFPVLAPPVLLQALTLAFHDLSKPSICAVSRPRPYPLPITTHSQRRRQQHERTRTHPPTAEHTESVCRYARLGR